MTPDQVEQLFNSIPKDEESRIQSLQQVLGIAQELQEDKSPGGLQVLAEKVGNGSREERWRAPLRKSGLLDFFLNLIKGAELDQDVAVHALRVVGNTCADQDESRQRVVDSGCMPWLVKLLDHNALSQIVIPALFNICVDYQPAQVAAYEAGLTNSLVELVIPPPQPREKASAYIHIVYKLLGLMATQELDPKLVPPATPYHLLTVALASTAKGTDSPDLEAYLGLCSAALAYLADQQFQESFLETAGAVEVFLSDFQAATEGRSLFHIEEEEKEEDDNDNDDEAQLSQLQPEFTKTLADLSANPRFVEICPLDGHPADLLLRWITSPNHHVILQSAACLALGNMARSDASSIALVREMSVHKSLVTMLSSSDSPATDAQLRHSVLSFLKNLSIPASNKAALGDTGLLDPHLLPRMWDMDTQPQIQFDAVSLARLLLVNCPANVRRVCLPPSVRDQTPLHQLLDLHRKADQEPIKMETARAAANVCRALYSDQPVGSWLLPQSSTSPQHETRSLMQDFHSKHPALPDTLLYLGLQTKFPVLRSELWFVLALMARSLEGATVVAQWIRRQPQIVNVLVEAVTGKETSEETSEDQVTRDVASGNGKLGAGVEPDHLSALGQLEPQQVDTAKAATTTTKVDRENGLVLIAQLLKQKSDELPSSVRSTFDRTLKTGGELVLGGRG